MIEITVVFKNPSIDNGVFLMGPFDYLRGGSVAAAIRALRHEAEDAFGNLDDDQCFYRLLTREVPDARDPV